MRSTIIAGLFVVELAIIGEAVVAVQAGQRPVVVSGPHLEEDGKHQVFTVGAHPTLNVDIGYADLTVMSGPTSQIDVSLGSSTSGTFMQETAAIVARSDDNAVRVSTTERGMSTGDNRMVTVIVPPETIVNVRRAGDVKLSGLHGETTVKAVGQGSISVEDFYGPMLDLASDGPITMHDVVTTHLDAKSDSDTVKGYAIAASDGDIEGEDRVSLEFAAGTNTTVEAHADGKVSAAGFATTDGDKIDGSDDSSSKTVRVGTGSGHLDVKSSDDDVALSQAG